MKLLLVGPYPPPHGGVSVHIAELRRRALLQGIPCRVLNTDRLAAPSPDYISVRRASGFLLALAGHALRGWTIHVHTNGHNLKSWLVALAGGVAGRLGPGSLLTLHSGKMPEYLSATPQRRWLATAVCHTYRRIICVSTRLSDAVESLGIPGRRIDTTPAFQGMPESSTSWCPSPRLAQWFEHHNSVFSATVLNRPEYGVELLVDAIGGLSARRKGVGCLLLGIGPEAIPILSLIAQRNLTRSVLMLGDVPHGECLQIMSRSAAFIRPTFTDGDSVSVREALALGIPVVASDAAARPHGTVLFETGNADDLIKKLECVLDGGLTDCAQ